MKLWIQCHGGIDVKTIPIMYPTGCNGNSCPSWSVKAKSIAIAIGNCCPLEPVSTRQPGRAVLLEAY